MNVCLSIAGAVNPEVNHRYGYYQGKAAQESFYQEADIPLHHGALIAVVRVDPRARSSGDQGAAINLAEQLLVPAAMSDVVTFMADVVVEPRPARNEIVAVRDPGGFRGELRAKDGRQGIH